MEKLIVRGGQPLQGTITISGSKNVALKALVAACLTSEEVVIENIPLISDFAVMVEILEELGGSISMSGHTARIQVKAFTKHEISLEKAARARTSAMFIAPLLARVGEAIVPNPGGCRLGARPIDRTIDGVRSFGVDITYHSEDGYFHAKTEKLTGVTYTFLKNTHTGTETLILTAVLAHGTTILKNAAEEPEIDDLITLLNAMGAQVKRSAKREITIVGVENLHGTTFRISPDRNEIVTFAVAALITKGDIFIPEAKRHDMESFIEQVIEVGGGVEETTDGMRFFYKGELQASDVTTAIYPGFMTDWQAPWAALMTQANGTSSIHETVFENKFGYIADLRKMGGHIEAYVPDITDRESLYNFNLEDDRSEYVHAIKISGPTPLHNAIVTTIDIRAGAAVALAALAAQGESTIFGVEKLDRGYERFEERLTELGATIERVIEP